MVPILVPKFGVNLVPIFVKNVNLVAILVKNVNLVAILVKSVNLVAILVKSVNSVKNVNGRWTQYKSDLLHISKWFLTFWCNGSLDPVKKARDRQTQR